MHFGHVPGDQRPDAFGHHRGRCQRDAGHVFVGKAVVEDGVQARCESVALQHFDVARLGLAIDEHFGFASVDADQNDLDAGRQRRLAAGCDVA